jgi:hypothetical protein
MTRGYKDKDELRFSQAVGFVSHEDNEKVSLVTVASSNAGGTKTFERLSPVFNIMKSDILYRSRYDLSKMIDVDYEKMGITQTLKEIVTYRDDESEYAMITKEDFTEWASSIVALLEYAGMLQKTILGSKEIHLTLVSKQEKENAPR